MMNEIEFVRYCQRLNLSPEAIEQITTIRQSQPVRRVSGRRSNMCARYPSHKMGRTIQAESRTVELVAIRCAYEFETSVLEYWDQPCQIKLTYQAKSGKKVTVKHTPDYFVLYEDQIGWEEWKPASQMNKLVNKMPARYEQQLNGRWRCPPGEEAAAMYGFFYTVRTEQEYSDIYQRNVAILEDYLLEKDTHPDDDACRKIIVTVKEHPGITLAELQREFHADDVLAAIAKRDIYTHLESVALVNAAEVTLFASAQLRDAHPKVTPNRDHRQQIAQLKPNDIVLWDERLWVVVNDGLEKIAMRGADGESQLMELSRAEWVQLVAQKRLLLPEKIASDASNYDRIQQCSPAALKRATKRAEMVKAYLAGKPVNDCAPRTLRRYARRYLAAEAKYGSGLLGVLDDNQQKGNRRTRLTKEASELLDTCIEDEYETLKQKPMQHVYNEYVRRCEASDVVAASYVTFVQRVKQRPQREQVKKRAGKRAAYQTGAQNVWLTYSTPRHGDFPWQLCHVDHTQLNLEIVCATTGKGLGRPWLSLLQDAFSRRILAVVLTFDPPSYRTCMNILVTCVQRHQRLPQQLVVDNGAEFRSNYFEGLLAYYSVTKLERPSGQPRFGSLIERLFRTSETELIHNLKGNTQATKGVRQLTKAVNPKAHAVWTLPDVHALFCRWGYEVYDQLHHSTLGQSPRAAYLSGMNQYGLRPSRQIRDDETFRMLVLPTTRRGSAKVQAGRGVRIQYLYYWCDVFRQQAVIGTEVAVKYDPRDVGIAYAFVNGVWERCVSEYYAVFHGRSEREMMLATAVLRKRLQQDRRQSNLNGKQLAAFLASAEGEEIVLEQQAKDRAFREAQIQIAPQEQMELVSSKPNPVEKQTIDIANLQQYGALEL